MTIEDNDQFPEEEEQQQDDAPFEELPPITTLKIDVRDARGIHYQGSFSFKVPSLRDEMEIGRIKSQLLPVSVVNDANALLLAEMIAYLEVTIQKGEKQGKGFSRIPEWWKPLEFYDPTPLSALYKEAVAYAARFRNDPGSEQQDADEDAGEGSEGADRSVVDGHVQPSKQRRTLHRTDSAGSAKAGPAGGGVPGGEG